MFRNESTNNTHVDSGLIARQQNDRVNSVLRELLDAQPNRVANAARPIFVSNDERMYSCDCGGDGLLRLACHHQDWTAAAFLGRAHSTLHQGLTGKLYQLLGLAEARRTSGCQNYCADANH